MSLFDPATLGPLLLTLALAGALIGFLAGAFGIGGGALSNLVMTLHGMPILRAVSTLTGVGMLIAVPGTLGYMLAGWDRADLPPDAVGFVWLAPVLLVLPTSLLTTRLGVRLAHHLTRRQLETGFGVFLLLVCARFVHDLVA